MEHPLRPRSIYFDCNALENWAQEHPADKVSEWILASRLPVAVSEENLFEVLAAEQNPHNPDICELMLRPLRAVLREKLLRFLQPLAVLLRVRNGIQIEKDNLRYGFLPWCDPSTTSWQELQRMRLKHIMQVLLDHKRIDPDLIAGQRASLKELKEDMWDIDLSATWMWDAPATKAELLKDTRYFEWSKDSHADMMKHLGIDYMLQTSHPQRALFWGYFFRLWRVARQAAETRKLQQGKKKRKLAEEQQTGWKLGKKKRKLAEEQQTGWKLGFKKVKKLPGHLDMSQLVYLPYVDWFVTRDDGLSIIAEDVAQQMGLRRWIGTFDDLEALLTRGDAGQAQT